MTIKISPQAIIKKYPVGSISSIVAVLFLAVLAYRYSTIAELHSSLEAKTAEAQKQSTNISYAAQLDEQVRALREANQSVSARLVNPQELAINLQYFYKLEAETGVKLVEAVPSNNSQGKAQTFKFGYKAVQYSVNLRGSFFQALNFLRRLEQGSSYCRIVAASCSPAGDNGQEKADLDSVSLSLTIEILGKA